MTTPLVAPTFQASPHSTTKGEMDNAFALVVDRLNAITALVDALSGVTPGSYATSSDLAAHVAASIPHAGVMLLPQTPAGKRVMIQAGTVTLDGSGAATYVYPTPYTGGTVLQVQTTVRNGHVVTLGSVTTTQCVCTTGTAADTVDLLVIGYV